MFSAPGVVRVTKLLWGHCCVGHLDSTVKSSQEPAVLSSSLRLDDSSGFIGFTHYFVISIPDARRRGKKAFLIKAETPETMAWTPV